MPLFLNFNAIGHRDYSIKDKQIRVIASKEKIEIWSPGIPIIALEKFKSFEAPPISRNPKLAYIFFKTGLVEERGIGMKELKAFSVDNGLPDPSFRIENEYFIVTVFRKKEKAILSENLLLLKEDEFKGYEFLKTNKRITKKQYAKHFSIDEKKAQRQLLKFKKLNLVIQEGKGPSTQYVFKYLS